MKENSATLTKFIEKRTRTSFDEDWQSRDEKRRQKICLQNKFFNLIIFVLISFKTDRVRARERERQRVEGRE